jgi:peptide/nickel transport system substrate-binding protein
MNITKNLKKLSITILMIVLITAIVISASPKALAQTQTGPVSREYILSGIADDSLALTKVAAGDIYFHGFRVLPNLVLQYQNNPNIQLLPNPNGGYYSFLYNPVPMSVTGKFNPFEYREFRYATNFLIDRNYFVQGILAGGGLPMISSVEASSPDYIYIAPYIDQLNIHFDEAYAFKLMGAVLTAHGAVQQGGKWYYNGDPITVKFFIRTDDPVRYNFGIWFQNELQKFGLKVEPIYGDLFKAFDVVYGSDPKELQWHIYTEGWGASAFTKYSDVNPVQMYAPFYGYMPGYQVEGWWNYANKTLDDIGNKLLATNFTSLQERNKLFIQENLLGIEESVRVFIGSGIEYYAIHKGLNGAIMDFGAGLPNRWTFMNAQYGNSTVLRAGTKYLFRGAMNPIGGFQDVYSVIVRWTAADPGDWPDPHTGIFIPWRVKSYTIQSNPQAPTIPVPSDAILWNTTTKSWQPVGSGVKSKVEIIYNFDFRGGWQDGSPMTMNDILYQLYILFQWASGTTPSDSYYTSVAGYMIPLFKGVKVINSTAIAIYGNYWYPDNSMILDFYDPFTSTPWYLYAAMEKVVVDYNKARFSQTDANAAGVAWLNFITASHAALIKQALTDMLNSGFVPKALTGYISPSEAAGYYQRAINFINQYNHAFISNGPFKIVEYNPTSNYIHAVAFENYPYGPDRWSQWVKIPKPEVTVKVPPVAFTGVPLTISIPVTIEGKLSTDAQVYYYVYSSANVPVLSGTATPSATGFTVTINPSDLAKLSPGTYVVRVYVLGSQYGVPVTASASFSLIPGSPTPTTTPPVTTTPPTTTPPVTTTPPTTTTSPVTTTPPTTTIPVTAPGPNLAVIGGAIVVLIVAIAAIVVLRRK